ncbi:MAG: hypothetical protein JKY48_00985, partial [Flavobacteriales bacterium]|nr:hypothetical protein [Flavobacteriales bacterium]
MSEIIIGWKEIGLADISDNRDGSDLGIQFFAAQDESTISEYRIFTLLAGQTFLLSHAELNENYTLIIPSGNSQYSVTGDENNLDVNGDLITENTTYKVVILSVADGVNAILNALSNASNAITLTS